MASHHASIAHLKARLSAYIAIARGGEDVVITDRGRPVARLAPLARDAAIEGRIADLARAGLVREPRTAVTAEFLRQLRHSDPAGRSVQAVLEERAEDR